MLQSVTVSSHQPRRLPQLDGLRGIAVLLVLLAHGSTTPDLPMLGPFWRAVQVLRTGYVGVDVFFALSGFLITRLLLAERRNSGRIDFGRFYVRRTLRIFPIYYLAVLVVASAWPTPPDLAASLLLYGYNYFLPFHPHPYPLEHVWSLAVEEQFYLLWPAAIALLPLARLRFVTGVAVPFAALAVAVALAATLPATLAGALIYTSLPTRMFSLVLGAWLAVREFEGSPVRAATGLVATFAGAALLLASVAGRAAHLIPPGGWYWCGALVGYGLFAVGVVAVVAAQDSPARLQRALSVKPLRFVGRISYGLYLYHLPVLYALGLNQAMVGDAGVSAVRLAGAYAIAFALAAGSYIVIERPLLQGRGWLVALFRVSPG